jgi:uncharacterized Zn finger protein
MITARGPITCPSCEGRVLGRWHQGRNPETQRCRSCGHVFDATWPGFPFEPERVVVSPSGEEPGRGAA